MQWLTDQRLKHRIVGVAVLLSIMIVFFPAMIKKSNQRLNEKMDYAVHMPAKPDFPEVDSTKATTLFKAVNVAHVEIPDATPPSKALTVSRAEPISNQSLLEPSVLEKMPALASGHKPALKPASKPAVVARLTSKPSTLPARVTTNNNATKLVVAKPQPLQKQPVFAVQIASFTSQDNASALVRELNQKGFRASFDKQGSRYRVLVGQLSQLNQAKNLQQQLASSTQLNGFIIKMG